MADDLSPGAHQPRPLQPVRRLLLGVALLTLILLTTGASGVFAFVICDGCRTESPTLRQLPSPLEEGGAPPTQPTDKTPKASLLPPQPEKGTTAK
jgi:hypothetical protein